MALLSAASKRAFASFLLNLSSLFFAMRDSMPKTQFHTQEQISAFLQELKTQTDRGAAIIAAAVLDELLELLILDRFIKLGSERRDALFDRTGAPLSSF